MKERAALFDTEDLDLSSFAPRDTPKPIIRPEQVRAVSEAANFRSREPVQVLTENPLQKEVRRYRTGRNIQLNIKARASAIEVFYAIADKQGWVLGETFEQAVSALQRELAQSSRSEQGE